MRHRQTVIAGADVETGDGHVVHAHSVRYRIVAVRVAYVRVSDGRRQASRGHRTGRRVLKYAAATTTERRRAAPVATDRTVVNAIVELYALYDWHGRRRCRPVDGRDDILLVLVGAHRPPAAPQPLAEPGQRRSRKRRHPGHRSSSGFAPVHRYEAFKVRHVPDQSVVTTAVKYMNALRSGNGDCAMLCYRGRDRYARKRILRVRPGACGQQRGGPRSRKEQMLA